MTTISQMGTGIRFRAVRLGILFAILATGRLGAQAPAFLSAEATEWPLAWIRFPDAEERYQTIPYLWLGKVDLLLTLDVAPAPGQVLDVLWGSKGDTREALLDVNGVSLALTGGGYVGFQWLRVPLPRSVSGKHYDLHFRQTQGRAAFIAEIRLTQPGAADPLTAALAAAAYRVTLKILPPTRPEAFPAMRPFWDRAAPAAGSRAAPADQAFRDAQRAGRLANEALYRCHRFVEGWLTQADAATGLIPRNLGQDRDIWNVQDAAADNYPFMVLTCAITDEPLFHGRMLAMLETETRLTSRIGPLPDAWSFKTSAFQTAEPDLPRIIFGASEYVKDGLLPLTEWLGPSPWSTRLLTLLDGILAEAPVASGYGRLPSTNIEVNGEMLQALSRAYWMTGLQSYLDAAVRLGDYYLLGDHHPTRDLDSLRLRDHGCEVIAGLSELYVACAYALPEKREAYREAMHALIDRVLEIGCNEHGMMFDTIHGKAGTASGGLCDTWGYNYNAVYAVYQVDHTDAYRAAVRHVLGNLKAHYTGFNWGGADGFADSIEGALTLTHREPIPAAAEWIESEIRTMWSFQAPSGIIEGWHGDGNSARTSIMFALWKTQGVTLHPWREDVCLGAVSVDGTLYVSITAEQPWSGVLRFDTARHRGTMNLPLDYPRINQFPEWFTVDGSSSYVVTDTRGPDALETRGNSLISGLPLALSPGAAVHLTVARAP